MTKERLKEVEELGELINGTFNNVRLDNAVCELAAKFAYEDMITESAKEIETGEHLVNEPGGYFEDNINCWFNDLYDDYYQEIYEILHNITLYEQHRELQLLNYQDVYSETYFEEDSDKD